MRIAYHNDVIRIEQQVLGNLDNSTKVYDLKIVNYALNNAQITREWFAWHNDTLYASYKTENPNIKVVLNGYDVDVVEKINDFEFLVNGERVALALEKDKISDLVENPETLRSGWIEISDPGVSWSYSHNETQNVLLNNAIASFSAGTLATILGWAGILATNPAALLGIAVAAITFVATMSDNNASIIRIERDIYMYNILYRKTMDDGYVLYNGNYEKVYDDEIHYFSKDIRGSK